MAEKNEKGGEKPQEKKGAHSFNRSASAPEEKPMNKGRPMQAPMKAVISASGKEVRGIVRLAGYDLRGSLPLRRAITSVKGIGINLGKVVSEIASQQLGINDKTMIGELSEQEVEKLENIMRNPAEFGVPVRMLNRQKDLFTGNNLHYISSDLVYIVRQDIDHEKDAYTWKGYRHTYGQKVRGQRTRTTGRTGMTVGVLRKAVLAKAGESAAAATGAAAQAAGAKAPAAAPGAKAPAGIAPKAPIGAPKAAAPAKKEEKK
ncbi:MAG: 30S ribosomal protein S13 [Candidatus Micrarchaeota archaeon]|nr:30S ribosomal protein S13 [Candidatus Micrarchaeota archaeon]